MEPGPVIAQPRDMTLREYYAGLAMQAIISRNPVLLPEHVAEAAVKYANALASQLSQQSSHQ